MAKGKKTGGRKKGSGNILNADVKAMVLQALDKAGGVDYLVAQATANPNSFLSLISRILPMQMQGSGGDGEIIVNVKLQK